MNVARHFSGIWKKIAWYAVKASDNKSVALALRLTSISPANWEDGLALVYKDIKGTDGDLPCSRVFVSPSVDGWVFVFGFWAFSHLEHVGLSQMNKICTELSKIFGDAQNFGTDDSINYRQWVRAKNGSVIRSFEYLKGEVFLNPETGIPTQAEISIFGEQLQENWSPVSNDIWTLASLWSRSPACIGEQAAFLETGFLAKTPQQT